jgi:hypothetical protein
MLKPMLVLVATVSVTGCWPALKTSSTVVGQVKGDPRPDTVARLVVESAIVESNVIVTATWQRTCRREIRDVIATTSRRELQIVGQDHRLLPLWVVFALVPAIGIGTAAVSTAVVLGSSDQKHTEERVVDEETEPCPAPAPNIPITLALASGPTIEGETDEGGVFQFVLSAADQEAGPVIVRARSGM